LIAKELMFFTTTKSLQECEKTGFVVCEFPVKAGVKVECDGLVAATLGHVVVAKEVRRAVGRGIGANVEVEDSSRGTRGQLIGWTVEEQVD